MYLPISETSFLYEKCSIGIISNNCCAKSSHCDSSGNLLMLKMVPDGLELATSSSSSSSSSKGIVHEETMEADLKLARLELPELEAEDTEETVDMVEMGLMVEALPLMELNPLSLLLWLWEVWGCQIWDWGGLLTTWLTVNPRWMASDWCKLSKLFFQRPPEVLGWGSEAVDLGDNWGPCSRLGVLLECNPILGGNIWGTGGSSKELSKRPEAEVRGLGWGCWLFCNLYCCCLDFNFCTSSDVNWTVEVLPPKNFSHPGAPNKKSFYEYKHSLTECRISNCHLPFQALHSGLKCQNGTFFVHFKGMFDAHFEIHQFSRLDFTFGCNGGWWVSFGSPSRWLGLTFLLVNRRPDIWSWTNGWRRRSSVFAFSSEIILVMMVSMVINMDRLKLFITNPEIKQKSPWI